MNRKSGAPPTEEDLEATAELPAIDFAPQAGRENDTAMITDIHVAPAIRVSAPELAESLRELEQQLKREQARMQEMEVELAAASGREAGLQARLAEADGQRAMLEARLVDADGQRAALEARIAAVDEQRAVFEASVIEASGQRSALEARLAEADARYAAMEVQLSPPSIEPEPTAMRPAASIAPDSADVAAFDELRRCSQRQLEALSSWYGFRALSDSLLGEAEARNAQLENQVATLGDALRALERKHHAAPPPPVRDPENQALRSELAVLKSEFGDLQAVLSSLKDRLQQSEKQVEAEVARSRELENEVQASASLLGSAKMADRPDRDVGRQAVEPPPVEAPRRALVRLHGGGEVVYPIGRRTTIGRMPDNDIQLDTANVSRHHAVILGNADHCVVEDLNSTNGVLVNGQRVGRHPLFDGDILSVGKAEFRYQQRS